MTEPSDLVAERSLWQRLSAQVLALPQPPAAGYSQDAPASHAPSLVAPNSTRTPAAG